MLLLMQGSIILTGPVSIFPSVSELINLLLCAIFHVVYVAWTQVMVAYDLVAYSSVTIIIEWLQIRPRILSLKDCNNIVPHHRSIYDERLFECSNNFRVDSKRRSLTEDHSTSDNLLIMCEVLATISVVCGITCNNWRYQIIHQSITKRISIYSLESSNSLFYRFQSIGPFIWIGVNVQTMGENRSMYVQYLQY